MGTIIFDDLSTRDSIPKLAPIRSGFSGFLVTVGLVRTHGDAAIFLVFVAGFLLAASMYLVAASVPDDKPLGVDTLRSGEVVPLYVR